jgi:uncharacterized membrane protein YeiB
VQTITRQLANGKFLGMLTLMFNYLLVVEFDILMGYAVTGAVVAAVLATSPRTQRIWP